MNTDCKRFKFAVAIAAICVFAVGSPIWAQSDSVAEKDRAHFMFDIGLDDIRSNSLVKEMGLESMMAENGALPTSDEFDVSTLKRIYGAVQFPSSVGPLMQMGPTDDLPINFFVRLEFNDKKGIEQIMEEITSDEDTRITEKNGKKYYSPPEGQGPGNLLVTVVDELVLEAGTPTYLYGESRNVVTKKTAENWKSLPDEDAVRVASDMSQSNELMSELFEMLAQNAGEEAAEMFSFVKDIDTMSFNMDPGSKNLFTFKLKGADADIAKEIGTNLNGLLFMARMGGKQGLKEMPIDDADAIKMMNKMIGDLKATVEGDSVKIEIPKPENFENVVKDVILPMIGRERESAEKKNSFRQIAIGAHNYFDAYKKFPFAGEDGLSWRAKLVPYVGFSVDMEMDEAWDSSANKPFAEKMPECFGDNGKTTSICWIKSDVKSFAEIRDGTSNTIMLLENPAGVPWSKPGDMTHEQAIKLFKSLKEGQSLIAAFYDGSIHVIGKDMSEEAFKAMLTPSGGEVVHIDH